MDFVFRFVPANRVEIFSAILAVSNKRLMLKYTSMIDLRHLLASAKYI